MRFEPILPDSLIQQIADMGKLDEYAPEMLTRAAPYMQDAIRKRVSVHNRTGDLAKSLKTGKPKKSKYGGYYLDVNFVGKDRNGHPNPVKAAQIEFGGVNRNQVAQPFLQAAANDCADDVATAMQEAYNDMSGGDK